MSPIRGAATHNLKHIDRNPPGEKLLADTGWSGSGTQALAFSRI
ncbi:hypothetical protein [Pseudoxanthomonas kaohsiungensis]|nr:hypothetical protein [Pseudoxanthomonas kaohsiungensis]